MSCRIFCWTDPDGPEQHAAIHKKEQRPCRTILVRSGSLFCAFCIHRHGDDSQTLKEEMLIQRQRGPAVETDSIFNSQAPHEQQHQGPDDFRSAQSPAGAAATAVNDHICGHRVFKRQRPVDKSLFTCQAGADPVHSIFSFPPEGGRRTIVCRGFQAGRFAAAGSPGSPAGRNLPFLPD